MKSVDIHEAETQLSRLIQQVSDGEEIVIARAGKPIARLVAYAEPSGPRTPGCWRGQVRMEDDFDETPDEIINSFYGEAT